MSMNIEFKLTPSGESAAKGDGPVLPDAENHRKFIDMNPICGPCCRFLQTNPTVDDAFRIPEDFQLFEGYPGINLSHDGRRLRVVCQGVVLASATIPGDPWEGMSLAQIRDRFESQAGWLVNPETGEKVRRATTNLIEIAKRNDQNTGKPAVYLGGKEYRVIYTAVDLINLQLIPDLINAIWFENPNPCQVDYWKRKADQLDRALAELPYRVSSAVAGATFRCLFLMACFGRMEGGIPRDGRQCLMELWPELREAQTRLSQYVSALEQAAVSGVESAFPGHHGGGVC